MSPLQIATTIYLAGILPTIVFCGWHNERHGVQNDLPAICNGLGWPLLFVVLCIIVPFVTGVVWLFEQPAKFGAWLARKPDPVRYTSIGRTRKGPIIRG